MTHRSRAALGLGITDYLTSMQNTKWEYLRMNEPSGTQLDQLGVEGWELVSVCPADDKLCYVFKRRAA